MKQQFTVFIILIVSAMTTFAAEHSYDAEFEPTPPEPFPADYKDYQILPFSFSPNQKMALIYVKRSLLYSLPGCSPLFLAALKPFRVLTEIPLDHSNLAANAHGYYAVNWAHDSSALVVIEGRKWGPDKVFLVPIRDGKAGLVADLTAEVKKFGTPQKLNSFKKVREEGSARLLAGHTVRV